MGNFDALRVSVTELNNPTRREQAARRAAKGDLIYVNTFDEGITRRKCGKGFTFRWPDGKRVVDQQVRDRIDALVIPPAWAHVVVCPEPNGHIQAVGTDHAGRRQYIYHERWQALSAAAKFDRMHLFGELLPKMRRRVLRDLNRDELSRERVLAAVVRLLDKAHLRVGNRSYAELNGAHGATTLLEEHVKVKRTRVRLDFPGKSGQQRELEFADSKVAAVIQHCEEIDGQFLFQYVDDNGEPHSIDSTDVNEALRKMSGETITAKDFRTWWGSVIVLEELSTLGEDETVAERRKRLSQAIASTAKELGNTKAVCRSSYVHPGLISAAETGDLVQLAVNLPIEAERELTIGETRFRAILPKLDFT